MKSTLNPIIEKLKKYLSANIYEKRFLKKHRALIKKFFFLYRKRRERHAESNPFERDVFLRKAKLYLSLLPKNLPLDVVKARMKRFSKKFRIFLANFSAAVAVREYAYKLSQFIKKKKIDPQTFVLKNNKTYRKFYSKVYRKRIIKIKKKNEEKEKRKKNKSIRKHRQIINLHSIIKKRGLSPLKYPSFLKIWI